MLLKVNISNLNLIGKESDTIITAAFERVIRGKDGITPHIGENGNWWIGEVDTGIPAIYPSGTTDYNKLENKPSIENIILSGNKSLSDLGIVNYDDADVKEQIRLIKEIVDSLPTKNYVDEAIKNTVGSINIILTQINGR